MRKFEMILSIEYVICRQRKEWFYSVFTINASNGRIIGKMQVAAVAQQRAEGNYLCIIRNPIFSILGNCSLISATLHYRQTGDGAVNSFKIW